MNKIIIPIVVSVVSFALISAVIIGNSSTISIENHVFEIPEIKSYKYNTVCDIGDPEKFMVETAWITYLEIIAGHHNDHEAVIEFFKTNEYTIMMNTTPDESFTLFEHPNGDLIPRADMNFYTMEVLMPVIFGVLNASPEVINMFTITEETSQEEFNNKIYLEIDKCK